MKKLFKNKKLPIIIAAAAVCLIAVICIFAWPEADINLEFIDSEQQNGIKILEHFSADNMIPEILDDLSDIDLYYKGDFNNKKYTVKKDENSENTVKYYKNDKLVLVDCGDESFDFFTNTKCGTSVKVSYINKDGKRNEVQVTNGICTVSYNKLNKKAPYGADDIVISYTTEDKENNVRETINIKAEGNRYYITSAQYFSDGEYIKYTTEYNGVRLTDESSVIESNNKK